MIRRYHYLLNEKTGGRRSNTFSFEGETLHVDHHVIIKNHPLRYILSPKGSTDHELFACIPFVMSSNRSESFLEKTNQVEDDYIKYNPQYNSHLYDCWIYRAGEIRGHTPIMFWAFSYYKLCFLIIIYVLASSL